ncbi:branched-chain alpha-keto acid dehydrogenase subunit E2 [Thioclava sp. SK-1]|uniref:endolytic transglycosylase MltG n=1 Tax=Thioclava sp. SK-1 TaxID=1889770 RepID=UPI000825A590|nr:endolytic transglycosylase MltG [Thioclava sp. SK-1]OCX67216.1 branched-chain alpha-keto acid dehydrogenase subunit E2 [Thioclava sp. SK-1]
MWRNIVSNFLTLMIVILVALAGVIAWAKRQYDGPGPLSQAVCVQVPRGGSFYGVSEQLVRLGAISSGYIFRIGADYSEKSGQLKFGSYLVEPNATMEQIVDQVTEGGPSTCGSELVYRIGVNAQRLELRELDPATSQFVDLSEYDPVSEDKPDDFEALVDDANVTRTRVVLAEGATSWHVTQALNALPYLSGELKDVPAEGSLAPNSYDITNGEARSEVVSQMQDAQAAILAEAWANRADGLPYDSPEEALIMASIVEKETGIAAERRQVASVFVNRIEQGMRLQTDPTVIYGVTDGRGNLGRGIRASELRRATPYNTYVIDGLPPTPIANPGRAAIEAALNPDSTNYVFFVADGTGGHAFATTLDEHNRNVARWREIEAERANAASGN